MEPDLSLTFHKAVVGYSMGKLPPHMLADIAQIEGLQVTEVTGVEQNQYGHDLAVGHEAGTVAVAFARYG